MEIGAELLRHALPLVFKAQVLLHFGFVYSPCGTVMSVSRSPPAPSREPPYGEVTVDGMLAFMKYSKEAIPDQNPNLSPKRSRWSRERSAAVLLASMFNGMRLRGSDEERDQPKGTVYANM